MRKYWFYICIHFFLLVPPGYGAEALKSISTAELEKELSLRGNTREQRIEKTEKNLKKLVNRKSIKKSVVGSVLVGAVTAHPVGLLVGGLVGAFVGRAEKYEKVEEKIAEMEQDIIVDEDDFLTDDEMRLTNFAAGDETVVTVYEDPEEGVLNESEIATMAPPMEDYHAPQTDAVATANNMPKITVANTPSSTVLNSAPSNMRINSVVMPKNSAPVMAPKNTQQAAPSNDDAVFGGAQVASLSVDQAPTVATATQLPKASLDSCYKRDETKTSGQSRRQEVKAKAHCFYMMY